MTNRDREITKAVAAHNSKEQIRRRESWFEEMKKADGRLRSFPNMNGHQNLAKPNDACMRWAIHFSMLNMEKLSAGDFINLQYELECFLTFEMKQPQFLDLVKPEPPPKETIIPIQQWIKNSLERIANKQCFHYLAPEESHTLLAPSGKEETWTHVILRESRGHQGVQPFFRLIVKHIDRLGRCPAPDCQRIYLKDRTNQAFCSAQCQWRTATRKVRKTPVERFGRRGRPRKEGLKTRPRKKKDKSATKGGKHGSKRR